MRPHIRRLDHSDAALLRELRVAALQDSPGEFGETLAEARNRSEQGWSDLTPSACVAEVDGRLVGMAFAFEDQTDPDTARVGGMWVAPSLRRTGVGLALLQAALSWAKARSKHRVRLWTIPVTAAEALYRRAGFVRTGLQKPFPGAPSRALIEMQLDLATVEEIPLPSGRMTKGVVRVGDTVRRPTKESSAFVARLLAHLEASACVWAPRYLGEDAAGRDILSYIPGATPERWGYFSDAQLGHAARIIRELHDLTRGSDLASGAVVCHNDPGPNNFVFVEDVPVAIIDFDMACAGEPLEDLGYMAWSWCISSKPERGPVSMQARQVRTLADAYGAKQVEREGLLDSVIERLSRNVRFWSERLADPSSTPTSPAKMLEVIEWSKREAQYTEAHRGEFSSALLC